MQRLRPLESPGSTLEGQGERGLQRWLQLWLNIELPAVSWNYKAGDRSTRSQR